jgi:hypothetical protein
MIQIPIEIGDVILTGRFKNKKVVVKEIGTDAFGLPTINGKGILKIRVVKLMNKQTNIVKKIASDIITSTTKKASRFILRNYE